MNARRHSGFSLVELLVAVAIFMTIMGGVTALFIGAVRTVRQGNQSIDAFATARSAMDVIERDLNGAFTARELGKSSQFFGLPNGFMFVGKLDNGQLGRVSYVIHPSVDTEEFQTIIVDTWQNMWERTVTFAGQRADTLRLPPGGRDMMLIQASLDFQAAYPPPSGGVVALTQSMANNAAVPANQTPTEFTVRVRTYALLRYQENVTDLDTFEPLRDGNGNRYPWPNIDLVDPSFDMVDLPGESIESSLYALLLTGINPDANPFNGSVNFSRDMRSLIQGAMFATPALHAVNAKVVSELVAAKRREIWLRRLAQDPSLPPILSDSQFAGFWRDPSNPSDTRPDPKDYKIAERIVATAELLPPNGDIPLVVQNDPYSLPVDALLIPGVFNYGDAENNFVRFFNTLSNIDAPGITGGYGDYMNNPSLGLLQSWDAQLVSVLGERVTDAVQLLGTPLDPRLPALVSPGFWLMDKSPGPGSPDFRRWFTQTIQVPSAGTRDLGTSVTPRVVQG